MSKITEKLEILPYHKKYEGDLKFLSYEWLNRYDLLEEEDELMLNDPKGVILDKGGFIFMAKVEDEVVGTISLEKMKDGSYEILKFAVKESVQGQGYGKVLFGFIIEYCEQIGAKKLILHSNSKLESALKLYLHFGFSRIQHIEGKFEKSDLSFELNLTD